MIGKTVSHYKILEKLGEGGMGVVYKAEDLKLTRTVALKFLPPALTSDLEAKERFIREAQSASSLEHANICSIHEIAEHDDQTFIVMGYYEGETLKKKIETSIQDGGLNVEEALDIAIQVAQGLSRAHAAGIIHRDIKSANVMLTSRGEARILDFGLARVSGRTMMTKAGTTLGTAAYMSPEQARGEQVDQRTDIWSLGVVLYEMLTGHLPFESDDEQALMYAILNENPKPVRQIRPEIPEAVEQILAKALARNRAERYQTAEELLSDLKIARGKEEPGGTIAAAEAIERKRRRKFVRGLILGAALLLLVGGGLFILTPLLQDQAIASNPRTIAFIAFENQTGDRSLDNLQTAIPSLLMTSLDESKFFRVLRWDQIHAALRQMGKDETQIIHKELGLELCRQAGIQALGTGTFTKAGNLYLTSVQIIDVNSGELLVQSLRADGQGVESILESQVDNLAKQVSRGLGVSRWATGASLKPVQQLSTTSADALNFCVAGQSAYNRMRFQEAVRNFELAVKADSTFAWAWCLLGWARTTLAEETSGDRSGIQPALRKAVQYASRASEREQWLIAPVDTNLQIKLTGARVKDWVAYWQRCLRRFPDDPEAHAALAWQLSKLGRFSEAIDHASLAAPENVQCWNLVVYYSMRSNQPEKALEAARQYSRYAAGEGNTFNTMGEALWFAGRFDEAIVQLQTAIDAQPTQLGYSGVEIGRIHFLQEEYDEALAWFDQAKNHWMRAYTLLWLGRLREAEKELANVSGEDSAEWIKMWIAYERGDLAIAGAHGQWWAQLSPPAEEDPGERMFVDYCLGLVDLKQGKTDSVEMRIERMASLLKAARRPGDSLSLSLQSEFYGRALRAALLYAADRPAEFEARLDSALISKQWLERERFHIAASRPVFSYAIFDRAWVPVPFDILPLAFLRRGMLDSAIAAYERAVDRKTDYLCPIIPRYHYRLAALYEQRGMKEKAIVQYEQFLKIWGKADSIYREPADARIRLAKLRGKP